MPGVGVHDLTPPDINAERELQSRRERGEVMERRAALDKHQTRAFFDLLFDERPTPMNHPADRWTVPALEKR